MPKTFFAGIALVGTIVVGGLAACGPASGGDRSAPANDGVAATTTATTATGAVTTPRSAEPDRPSSSIGRGVVADTGGVVAVGAARLAEDGFALLRDRRVGVITNDAATVGDAALIDVLIGADEVEVVSVFTPEHGLGALDPAGTVVEGGIDPARGIRVHSLYGSERAPTADALADLDVLVFDLQDVGVRAYTYLATMGLAMAAAADADLPFVVLDRPNPLGGEQLSGFVRDPEIDSLVAQYPVPAVHGLTAGELALAIKGEGWLGGLDDLDLEIVTMDGWHRGDHWLDTGLAWLAPSPSLPTVDAVALYPGTVLFEATSLSVGRGTEEPFTVLGGPWVDGEEVARVLNDRALPGVRFEAATFTPTASASVPDPPLAGRSTPGVRILVDDEGAIRPVELGVHLLEVFRRHADDNDVPDFLLRPELLDLLAGTERLRVDLEQGTPADAIIAGWSDELDRFAELRRPYLLYD